jgi:hypothetical protein
LLSIPAYLRNELPKCGHYLGRNRSAGFLRLPRREVSQNAEGSGVLLLNCEVLAHETGKYNSQFLLNISISGTDNP